MYACSSSYIKDNDHKYGVIVMSHNPKTSKVIGLQCRFCIAFSREDNVTSKRKATTKVQGWFAPFCYDNIDNHMRTQHGTKWLEYDAIHSNSNCNQFFTDVFVVFKTLIKTHFVSKYLGDDILFSTSTRTLSKLSLVTWCTKLKTKLIATMKMLRRNLPLAMKINEPLYLFDVERLLQRRKSGCYYCSSKPSRTKMGCHICIPSQSLRRKQSYSSDIRVKSCSKWSLISWHYFVIIGRFAFLVCCFTELEIWPNMLLALWPDFMILCMTIVLSSVFGAKCINSTLSKNTSLTKWSTSVARLIHLLIHRWKESSTKLMKSNIMSCDTMLDLSLLWLVSASTQSDSNAM